MVYFASVLLPHNKLQPDLIISIYEMTASIVESFLDFGLGSVMHDCGSCLHDFVINVAGPNSGRIWIAMLFLACSDALNNTKQIKGEPIFRCRRGP